MNRRARTAVLAAALALAACASTQIREDVARVRELTRAEELPRVAGLSVDPRSEAEVDRLLGKPLDAAGAVRAALLGNRELRATLRELGVPRGRLVQAGLLPNPTVELELLPERNSEVELRVELDVTHALLAPVRARALAPEVEAARLRAAGLVLDLGFRARAAFYRVQAADERFSLAMSMVDASAAGRDAARALHAAGNLRELDAASREAAHEQLRADAAGLELELARAREELVRLLGVHGTATGFRLSGTLPSLEPDPGIPPDVERRAVRASLEIAASREHLEALARQVGFTRLAGALPELAVDVHGLHGDPSAASDRLQLGGGLTVEVPLFDRDQGTAAALAAELGGALERYHGLAVELRSEAREGAAALLSAHQRARQYDAVIVPLRVRVTEQALLQYSAMQIGVFQLLDARREELSARLAGVEARREYWTAVAAMDALLAGRRVLAPEGAAKAELSRAPAGGH